MELNTKIDKNEECPCGSKVVFKNCCLSKSKQGSDINKEFKSPKHLNSFIMNELRKCRPKLCLHPNKDECSDVIIKAHSLQNNGVLTHLAENNHVNIIDRSADFNGININITTEGRNLATTFTGFCKKHDSELFSPIECRKYDKNSKEQNFIFAYRAYAQEYYKKQVAIQAFSNMFKAKPSLSKAELFVTMYRSYQLSINDFAEYSKAFNEALISKQYDILDSYVVEFNYNIPFATCFMTSPYFNFKGNPIQSDMWSHERLKALFITVIPQGEKSFLIISWLKEDYSIFKNMITQLMEMSLCEIKKIFNNLVPEYSENIIFKPSFWNRLSDFQKKSIIEKVGGEFNDTGNSYINNLNFAHHFQSMNFENSMLEYI